MIQCISTPICYSVLLQMGFKSLVCLRLRYIPTLNKISKEDIFSRGNVSGGSRHFLTLPWLPCDLALLDADECLLAPRDSCLSGLCNQPNGICTMGSMSRHDVNAMQVWPCSHKSILPVPSLWDKAEAIFNHFHSAK